MGSGSRAGGGGGADDGGEIRIWRRTGVGALRMGRSGDIGGIACVIDGAWARGCRRQNMVHGMWTPALQAYRVVEIGPKINIQFINNFGIIIMNF